MCEISYVDGSESWCLREKEMVILRRTERAMNQVTSGVKVLDQRKSEELMEMLKYRSVFG